jgi:hypothetical protein
VALKVNGGRLYTNVNRVFSGVTTIYGGGLHAHRHNFNRNPGVRKNFASGEHSVSGETIKAGWPNGNLHPAAWWFPRVAGTMSSRNEADFNLDGSASGVLGFPISGSTTLTITVADAAGELIVSGDGTATITLTGDSSLLTASLNGDGTATLTITVADATLGAEASLVASATFEITGALTPYAIGHMTGAALAGTELSPDNLAQSLLDLQDVEASLTVRQALRLIAAAAAAKVSGAGTTTVTIRNAVADSKNRIVATVDADGNRSAITYDLE